MSSKSDSRKLNDSNEESKFESHGKIDRKKSFHEPSSQTLLNQMTQIYVFAFIHTQNWNQLLTRDSKIEICDLKMK